MNPSLDALVEASVHSAVLAGIVLLLLWILRVREAHWRHSAWTTVLGAMLVMPFLPEIFPPVPMELAAPVEPLVRIVAEPVRVIAAPPQQLAVPPPIVAPAASALARNYLGMLTESDPPAQRGRG